MQEHNSIRRDLLMLLIVIGAIGVILTISYIFDIKYGYIDNIAAKLYNIVV